MGIADDAVEIRARGWRTLAALHGLIEVELERSLQAEHGLSVVEFTVLDALSDRRGIYTELTEQGRALLHQARPTHDKVLEAALSDAREQPELAPLVDSLHALDMVPARG